MQKSKEQGTSVKRVYLDHCDLAFDGAVSTVCYSIQFVLDSRFYFNVDQGRIHGFYETKDENISAFRELISKPQRGDFRGFKVLSMKSADEPEEFYWQLTTPIKILS